MTRSRYLPILSNRYFSLFVETACVTAWAQMSLRPRTDDEVAAAALVVMIIMICLDEVASYGLKIFLQRKLASKQESVREVTSTLSTLDRASAIGFVAALVAALTIVFNCAAFALAVLVFDIAGMRWASDWALSTGLFLVDLASRLLIVAAGAMWLPFLKTLPGVERAQRIKKMTASALAFLAQLRGIKVAGASEREVGKTHHTGRFPIPAAN